VRLAWLTATPGQWTNSPTGIGYQWERCDATGGNCQPIPGSNDPTYQLTAADVHSKMTVVVSATNTSGTAHATAAPTAMVAPDLPVNTQPPVVQGAARQSSYVAMTGNQWNASPDTTFAQQWERCDTSGSNCADIAGATAATYAVMATDVGHTLRVRAIATNPDGPVTATSGPTAVVLPAPPRWKSLPTIGADPGHVGDGLTITPGTWTGPSVLTDNVELMRCLATCRPISGFSGTAYTIASGDAGAVLRVRETASNAGGATVVWSSWYVGPVTSAASGAGTLSGQSSGLVAVRNAGGHPLAFAQLTATSPLQPHTARDASRGRAASGPRVVRISRAKHITGKLRAWVCTAQTPHRGAPACTSKVLISGDTGQVRLPGSMSGKLRVIVVRLRG
jgi:hypothetical protein